MKHFFHVLWGGLIAVGTGVVLAYASTCLWGYIRPYVQSIHAVSSTASSGTVDMVSSQASGPHTVRYTSTEEEDLIDMSARSLASSGRNTISAHGYIFLL